jgi:tetratricopeptide (TPR) repeat protein
MAINKKKAFLVLDILEIEREASEKGLIPSFDINCLLEFFYKVRDKVTEQLKNKESPIVKLKTMYKVMGELFEVSGKEPSLLMSEGLVKKKLDCDLACGIYLSIARELKLPLSGVFLPSHTILVWGKHEPFLYFDTIEGNIFDMSFFQSEKISAPSPISDKEFMSTYYNTVGVRFAETEKHQDAISFFDEALKCYSLDARLYYNKAVSLAHLGYYEQSLHLCKQAIKLDSSDCKAYFNMGVCLALSGKYEEAVNFYNQAAKIHPKDYHIYYHRADALLRSGHLDLAIKDYKQALVICPDDSSLRKDYETALYYSQEP